jgi:hypothetical protein
MGKLVDLTGATITVPSGWTCPSEFLKVNLYGKSYNTSWVNLNPATNDVPNLWFGWSWSWEKPFGVRSSSDVILYASDIPNSDVDTYKNSNSISWFITGGDTSNQTLIQWLLDNNATIEGGVYEGDESDEPEGPSIKGSAIPGATSYALYEKKNNFYNMLAVSDAINFSLGKLNLSGGTHKLVIKARAEDYEVSDYSNEVSYSVAADYEPYLTFSSPSSFTIGVSDNTKYWDGTLEYSTDTNNWSE